ncbi:DUF6105 family protein [Allorhizobium undicola]|uniref:DUF6105 family protein n=1 Tax=Allorhizobium undicola TaxID=78527 RepID=UPI0004894AB0|nr:DUF6105 family protein [Allorhizobium undicola]
MRWLLIFWAGPIFLLGSWYYLSLNDMSFGIFMLTRQANDLVFQVYGNMLGLDPASLPPLVMRAIVVDSAVLFALVGLRRRAKIIAWLRARRAQLSLAVKDRSLSSAP